MTQNNLSELFQKFICSACDNASLAETDIPIAKELKSIIVMLYERGLEEQAIINYMISNYSEFIFLDKTDSSNFFNFFIWIMPVLASFFFAYLVLRIYNKKSSLDPQLKLPLDF